MNVWQAAADLVRRSGSGALATVARVRGSTPVPAGTKMLVGAEGRLIGSVGGGCVEADVIRAALDAQAARVPALVTHHLNADLAGDLGLSCGGTVEIFVEPLVSEPRYVRALEQAGAAEGGGVVTTAVSWADGGIFTSGFLWSGLSLALWPEPSNSSPSGKPSRVPFTWHAWLGHCGPSELRVHPLGSTRLLLCLGRSLPAGLGTSPVA